LLILLLTAHIPLPVTIDETRFCRVSELTFLPIKDNSCCGEYVKYKTKKALKYHF